SNGRSGDRFQEITVRLVSAVTVVRSGGVSSSSSTQCQPSSTASRSAASNRPERLLAAPRPFRGRSGTRSSGGGPGHSTSTTFMPEHYPNRQEQIKNKRSERKP